MRIPNLAFASLLLLLPLPMMADTYTYTGLDFTFVELASSAYTTNDSITGSFTMTGSLAPDQALEDAPFLTYSFSDGVQTFTNLNSTDRFKVATDANGTIDQWFLSFAIPLSDQLFPDADKLPANSVFDMESSSFVGSTGEDREFLFLTEPDGTLADSVVDSNFEPGSWAPDPNGTQGGSGSGGTGGTGSGGTAVTPEPSSLILLGIGLLGLAGAARRRLA